MSGAQAADLPVTRQYRRLSAHRHHVQWSGDLGLGDCYRNSFQDRARVALTVDTRTATEYGAVRTFAQAAACRLSERPGSILD
jgi:hypothetical protein